MPDNSFEKNLSCQMEGFTYPASDAVWQNLEAILLQRKKRRRAIFWIFSGLLLISAGLYFYAQPVKPKMDIGVASKNLQANLSVNSKVSQDKSSAVKVSESDEVATKVRVGQGNELQDEGNSSIKADKNNSAKNELHQQSSELIIRQANIEVPKKNKQQNNQNISDKSAGINVQPQNEQVSSQSIKTVSDKEQNIAEAINIKESPVSKSVDLADKKTGPILTTGLDSISVSKNSNKKNNTDSPVVVIDVAKKDPNNRSLQFGLRFEAGSSGNSESDFNQTKSADMAFGPIAGAPAVYSYPYSQDPSYGWSIGAFLRKPLSKKVNLQTGLTYHHYRTSTPVGPKGQGSLQVSNGQSDMIFSPYYQQGDDATYQNNYHLLSVPIELNLQLNKGEKLPISWQFGIEPGWMMGSDAIFKDTSAYLYNDKDRINKFQLGLQTGISIRIFSKQKHPMELGPVFQYMLTPTFKSGSGYDGHLHFFGLRADWVLFNSGLKQR